MWIGGLRRRFAMSSMLLLIGACGGAAAKPCAEASAAPMRKAAQHGAHASRALGNGWIASPPSWQQPYTGRGWYPWSYYWEPGREYRQLLDAQVPAKDALLQRHRAACETIPDRIQALSPFESYAFGSARLDDGVLVHLVPDAGPPDALLVALRCHEAWLRLAPRDSARDDVLGVDGISLVVDASGRDTIEVMIVGSDRRAVDELERRAHIAVRRANEMRARRGSP